MKFPIFLYKKNGGEFMTITREQIIKRLTEKSGYYQKDIRQLLHCLDEVVLECFDEVTDDEEVSVQIVQGIKCGCKIMPQRTRKNPKTGDDVVCSPTNKPFVKFSQDFRKTIQNQYETKVDG